MLFLRSLVFLALPIHFAAAQCQPVFISRLLDTPPDATKAAGYVVALDGDYAIVASPGSSQSVGHVTVFFRSGGSWTEQAQLVGSDTAMGDQFGGSCAISGDTVVVGAYFHNGRDGAAYVFRRSGTTWTQEAKINKTGGYSGAVFGVSSAISGDTIAVGAPGEGVVYVFSRSEGVWTQRAALGSDGGYSSQLGTTVVIRGDTIFSGAPSPPAYAGAVYAYTRTESGWAQEAKLTASDASSNSYFGNAIAFDGQTAVVGAFRGSGGPGAAYVFARSGGTWTQQQKLTQSLGANDLYGYSTAVSGDAILIGAQGENWPYGVSHFYSKDPSGLWTHTDSVTGSAFNQYYFGFAGALDRTTAIVGAYATGTTLGGGFAYELTRPNIVSQPQDLSINSGQNAAFSVTVASNSSVTYQWRRDGLALTDTPPYSGTSTNTLHIAASSADNARHFDCVVTNSCGIGQTRAALLTVEGASCPGDLNGDGFVDDSDFVLFASDYNLLDCADPAMPSGCPSDLNRDAFVDDSDFILFAAAYNTLLCP